MRGPRETEAGKSIKNEAVKKHLGRIVTYAKEYNDILQAMEYH